MVQAFYILIFYLGSIHNKGKYFLIETETTNLGNRIQSQVMFKRASVAGAVLQAPL